MLVMQEPINTSSIFSPCTSDSKRASSGSFGAQRMGLFDIGQIDIDHRRIFRIRVAFQQLRIRQPFFPCPERDAPAYDDRRNLRRSSTSAGRCWRSDTQRSALCSAYRYSRSGTLGGGIGQLKRLLNFQIRQTFNFQNAAGEDVFLPFFSTVSRPCLIAYSGMACTRSRRVMPGCICL